MKKCRRCDEEKTLDEFYKSRQTADGRQCYCKVCSKAGVKKYRADNPDKYSEYYKAEYEKRKDSESYQNYQQMWREVNRAAMNAAATEYYQENSGRWAVYRQTRRARERAGGTFSLDEWNSLCEKYENRCLNCGAPECTIDHIIPLAHGGSNTIDNLQPLCLGCNLKKGTKTIDYRPKKTG